jgi:hypothetical protein
MTYGEWRLTLHSFFIFALDGGEWTLYPWGESPYGKGLDGPTVLVEMDEGVFCRKSNRSPVLSQ